ncbi:phosphoglycerate mutase [Melghirimyces profundicolus]|uniref:Phosphoglycerate mutase n=1 Tax=Melghirimyces profundicolus TaxID=1242148 RepID=A0A2T6BXQ1_9BACL|nr:hypothetical protein [Melghirimyces profundicolus]PTX60833.1 phosphoglycerate mutase [Melghirimyces profundicolus]
MSVYLLFIDGVGLGENASHNPWFTEDPPRIREILGGPLVRKSVGRPSKEVLLLSTDASLGVEGLPQSATGQAAIFTGRNAPKAMGEHQSGLPFRRLRDWVQRNNLYLRVADLGLRATFANGYTEEFFRLPTTRRGWISVSTATILSTGQSLRMVEDLLAGQAVYHDLTRQTLALRRPGEVEVIEPDLAARHLLDLGKEHDLVVHEFFLSDLAGHRQDRDLITRVIRDYDRFLGEVVANKKDGDTVVLVSDHGNSEDFRIKTHTLNPVPTLVAGAAEDAFRFASARVKWDLTGITPLLLHLLSQAGNTGERGENDG